MTPFRTHHLLKILDESERAPFPLDAFLRFYFRNHKSIGSKDRQEICSALYGMVRWKGLIDSQIKFSH